MDDIVITGIGVISPLGLNKEEFWSNDFKGISKTKYCHEMKDNHLKSQVYSPIENFDVNKLSDDDMLNDKARFTQMGVLVGDEAISDSKILDDYESKDIGIIYSSAIGGTPEIQNIYERLTSSGKSGIKNLPIGEEFYNDGMFNYPATYIAEKYNLGNMCCALSTGCTAGLDALISAMQIIRQGEAKAIVVGASEAPLCSLTYSTLDSIGALTQWQGDPTKASRPFDKNRSGFVLAEGATAVVLESKSNAIKRHSKIYAKVKGAYSLNNAYHMTNLNDSIALEQVIKRTLELSNININDINYINAHGSSTKQNDSCESKAIKRVFGDVYKNIPVSSTKSMMGHSLSSASLMALASTVGAIEKQTLPPNINYEQFDCECDLNIVKKSQKHDIKNALVMASGFGGIHSACILQRM